MSLKELGINVTSQIGRSTCPRCSKDRKKSNDLCLSYNDKEGLFYCHHCGWSGKDDNRFKKTEYDKLNHAKIKSSDKFIKFFEERKINFNTIEKFKIIYNKKNQTIAFPYFYYDNLINIKYRSLDKKFSQLPNADKIPYNYNSIIDAETLVIVEGEIDCMTVSQAGYNCISLPDGAFSHKAGAKLKWLDNVIKDLEKIPKIILALDQDQPGQNTQEELARRLGKERCFRALFPHDCKDMNEVLMKAGEKMVISGIKDAQPFDLDGIHSAQEHWDEIEYIYQNGFPSGAKIDLVNEFEFYTKYLNIYTGIPSHGKTTFVFNVLVELSKKHGWKHLIFSPEHRISSTFIKLIRIFTEKQFNDKAVDEETINQARIFLNEYFLILEPITKNTTIDVILEHTESLIKQRGVNTLTLDPWNTLEHNWNRNTNETNYVSFALQRLKDFAKEFDILINLVAHPTKMSLNGNLRKPSLYDISGSANFYNKMDNGFIIYRKEDVTEVEISKIKEDHIGKTGIRYYEFYAEGLKFKNTKKQEINIF